MRILFYLTNGMKLSIPARTLTPFQQWVFSELQANASVTAWKVETYSK